MLRRFDQIKIGNSFGFLGHQCVKLSETKAKTFDGEEFGLTPDTIVDCFASKIDHLVITYEGSPLVIVQVAYAPNPIEVLNWYAENYAFERSKLGWGYCEVIRHHSVETKS